MTTHHIHPGDPIPSYAPGDTLEFHGGKHTGAHVFRTHGTEAAPVTITNAAGEYADFTNPTPIPESSAPHSIVLFGKHTVLQENPAGGELAIRHPVGAGGVGFAISADHVHVRNIRCRGAWLNTRARVLGGSLSGFVCSRSGKDDPNISNDRGSGYALYGQCPEKDEPFIMTDLLCALGYTTIIHMFGGENAARDFVLRRSVAIAAASLSSMEAAKPAVVIDEENSTDAAICEDVIIEDNVIGSPYLYPSGGGLGAASLQIGGGRANHVNGTFTIRNNVFFGPPNCTERVAWCKASGNTVFHRPGQSGVVQGWSGRDKLLFGPNAAPTIVQSPGWPEPFPTSLQSFAWVRENPTEIGRAHILVAAFHNERSININLSGIVGRGKRYRLAEIMRETTQDFTGSADGVTSVELPDISPAGVQQGRDPHPVLYAFLLRRAA